MARCCDPPRDKRYHTGELVQDTILGPSRKEMTVYA